MLEFLLISNRDKDWYKNTFFCRKVKNNIERERPQEAPLASIFVFFVEKD